jgi:hypothetical protein
MFAWVEIALLYLVGMGLLCWLGGISSAADAIARWGRETAEPRECATCAG